MANFVQKTAFKVLGLENYLHFTQSFFFILYRSGMLKSNDTYKHHYFDREIINKGDTVIDIGANLGYYTKLFSNWIGNTGKIYAVEPIDIYNKINKSNNKNQKNIVFLPFALGLEEKEVELVTSLNNGAYSTGLPHVYEEGRDGKLEKQDFRFKAMMKIPSKLFADIEHIDFVKCDIEGYEFLVLNEMKSLIEYHKPIVQVEVWGQNEIDVLNLFKELNYKAYKVENMKLTENTKVSGDYIFIHQDKSIPQSLFV